MVRSRSRSTGKNGEGWRRSCHTSALRLATAVTTSARLSAEVNAKRWPTEVNQKSALTAPMAKRIWPATSAFVAGRSCALPRGSREHCLAFEGNAPKCDLEPIVVHFDPRVRGESVGAQAFRS